MAKKLDQDKGPHDINHSQEIIEKLTAANNVLKNELTLRSSTHAKEVTKSNTEVQMINEKLKLKQNELEEVHLTLESVINSLKAMKIESSSTQITLQTQLQKLNKDLKQKDETIKGLQSKLAQLEITLNELKYDYKVTINSLHNSYTSVTENALRSVQEEIEEEVKRFGGELNTLNNDYLNKIKRCY